MARLNGFRERRVVRRYALRNALAPSVQVFAQNIQYLIGGIIVVEYLFAYPGHRQGARRRGRDPRRPRGAVARDPDRGDLHPINIVADLLVVLLVPKLRTSRDAAMRDRLRFARTGTRARSASPCSRSCSLIALFGPFFAPHAPDEPIGMPFEGPSSETRRSAPTSSAATCSRACSGAGAACSRSRALATLLAYVVGGRDRPPRRLHAARSSTRC